MKQSLEFLENRDTFVTGLEKSFRNFKFAAERANVVLTDTDLFVSLL